MELIPKGKFQEIINNHLINDTGFQAAVTYLRSDEWKTIIEKLKQNRDFIEFTQFLKTIDIDIDLYVHCVENQFTTLEIPDVPVGTKKDLKPFIVDLEKNLPTDMILSKLRENTTNNPKFRELYDKLASTETRSLIEKVLAIPEIKNIIKILSEMGLQLDQSVNGLYMFLGWK